MTRLIAFCESPGDFRVAADLVDRVFREEGPSWVADLIGEHPDAVRSWHPSERGAFFDVHTLRKQAKDLGVPIPHGHFNGRPGGAGALMARTVFHIVRALNRRASESEAIRVVVLVWDMDQQSSDRRRGLRDARDEAQTWASFQIVIGCPDPEREAWVLAGFEPIDDAERVRLENARRQLGFSPTEQAHRLVPHDDLPKRVLHALVNGDPEREARCWRETPLDLLWERGEHSGLREYLDEVRRHILPLMTRG